MTRHLPSTALAGALAGALLLASVQARAEIYALVVGIDRYEHITPLHGAVNDARDIAAALRESGASEVHLLVDGDATRSAVLGTLEALIDKAESGDHLFFTYAGHGGQEKEARPGSEADGLDETFMLAGFDPDGPGAAERIRDDDIAVLLQKARHLSVIFVADSCHSGTMTRGFDKRSVPPSVRFADYGPIEDDPLPPPPPVAEPEGDENLLFFAAVREFELAPEIEIDGQQRGALSWSFARGIRGAADSDGDGAVSKGELERFVRVEVKQRLQGRQHPQVEPAGVTRSIVMPARPMRALLINASPEQEQTVRGLIDSSIELTVNRSAARLLWDLETDEVILAQLGDLAATLSEGTKPPLTDRIAGFESVVDRWRLTDRLAALQSGRSLQVDFLPGDQVYRENDVVAVQVSSLEHDFFTLFNVTSRGTLNFIYPLAQYGDALMVDHNQPQTVQLKVTSPFGAEHFVAIASGVPLLDLHKILLAHDGKSVPDDFFTTLRAELEGNDFQLGLHGVYSRPAE